jgi:hypothetical protein
MQTKMWKMNTSFLPANRQGIAIDALMILLNLFLFPILTARIGNLFDESFRDNQGAFRTLAALMLFVLAGRLFGLYLKRFSLQTRLERAGQTAFPLYFFILNTPVFIFAAAFVAVLLSSVAADFGIVEKGYGGQPKESQTVSLIVTFSIVVLMCLEVYFLYRLTKPLSENEKQARAKGNWKFNLKGELAADFGLFAYMIVWQIFYNQTSAILLTFPANVTETVGLKIFSVSLTFVAFLLFYLSPRAVFLVEDRRYLGTWLFIFGVFLSSIVSYW